MNVQGISLASIINIKAFSDALGKLNLNVGDKINVQVVGMNNNEITLKLPNGVQIKANVLVPLNVSLGDFLDLTIKEKNDSQIMLETVKNPVVETKNEQIQNILTNMKFIPNDRNIEIAKNIIKENLPVNKEVFQKVVSAMNKFNFDIKKAVFFVVNDLNTEEDANTLNKYADSSQKLSGLINELEQKINIKGNEETINAVINKFNVSEIINNFKNIGEEQKEINNLVNNFKGSKSEIGKIAQDIVKNIVDLYNFNKQVSQTDINVQTFEASDNNQMLKDIITKSNDANNIKNEVVNVFSGNITENDLEKILPNVSKDAFELIKNNEQLKSEVVKIIKELPSTVLKSNDNELKYENNDDVSTKLKKFLSLPEIKNDIKLYNENQINKALEQIDKKIVLIKQEAALGNFNNGNDILNIANEIKNSINFMSNVNNTFNFYQIPIFMNNSNNDFEVYVAKRDKRSKIDPKNVTLFISLQTQNLGVVESLINVNGKKVEIKFRLEDEGTINLFEKNKEILTSALESIGYKLNKINFVQSKDKTNLINVNQIIRDNTLDNVVDVKV